MELVRIPDELSLPLICLWAGRGCPELETIYTLKDETKTLEFDDRKKWAPVCSISSSVGKIIFFTSMRDEYGLRRLVVVSTNNFDGEYHPVKFN